MPPKKTPAKRVTKPSHKRTEFNVQQVTIMAAIGTPLAQIAQCIDGGIDVKTLTKHYREEIDTAWIIANAKVGGAMYNKAIGGDVSAQKYWMGCRAGWKETNVQEHILPDQINLIKHDGS